MAGKKRNSSFEILTAMQDLNTPAGALQLAQILHLPSASIGRELLDLEKAGLLVKVQNKGRILTPQGERFLEEERSRREKMKAANELIEAASMETESGLEDILLVRKLLEGYAAEACAERIEPKEIKRSAGRLSLCNPPWKGGKRGRSGVPSENRASLRQPVYLADVKAHPDRPGRLCALQPGSSPL